MIFGHNYLLPDPAVLVDTPKTVILKHLCSVKDGHYVVTKNAVDVFIEDICNNQWDFTNNTGQTWARQLDPERTTGGYSTTDYHVANHGAKLWILGLKTEGVSCIIDSTNGASTELLGGDVQVWNAGVVGGYGFTIENSIATFVYAAFTDGDFAVPISEDRGTGVRTLPHSSLIPRGPSGSMVPLYAGAPNAPPQAPSGLAATASTTQVQVAVSWNITAGATGYNLWRATGSSTATYTKILPNTSATSYIDNGVSGNTTYYYAVTALNAAGEGVDSGYVIATTIP